MENTLNYTVTTDPKIKEFRETLRELRKPGIFLLTEAKESNNDIKKNKLMSKEDKEKRYKENNEKIQLAKANIEENKEKINTLVKEAASYTRKVGLANEKDVAIKAKEEKKKIILEHNIKMVSLREE